ncbi:MAG: radical SAM family heme chaperone HemW [Flavobacteriaceae bacterium]|nr:radical SAM family heme chaperone HemW [Flavobacteriaceae bacterium]
MSSIYIHIPFCKQTCHYCDFHFSTSLKKKDEMIQALAKEIAMRKNECDDEVETIYFGGGTPSVLPIADLNFLIDEVYKHYKVVQNPEFTLESNPDDLDNATIRQLANSAINRLSIGIQSFFEDDLKMMNRAHNANQAKECLEEATKHFDNITIDLIYGIPGMTNEKWMQNIETALGYNIPHISAYALTVEPKTALKKLIEKGVIDNPKDETAENHFFILTEKLKEKGFIHYELSNFGKEGYFSKNNTSYWSGKKYIGIGPSAHSYNGTHRSWNIANNAIYIKEILSGNFPNEIEKLTTSDRYNEYVMTGLRTIWGISLEKIREDFGDKYYEYLMKSSEKLIKNQLIELKDQKITVTQKGKFLSDGIASELFVVNSQ